MKIDKALTAEKAAELRQTQSFEALKHLTTLNTGSIILLVGILEKLFPKPMWKFLLYMTLALFVFSILCSAHCMLWMSAGKVSEKDVDKKLLERTFKLIVLLSYYGFILGIAVFVVFVIKNLYISN